MPLLILQKILKIKRMNINVQNNITYKSITQYLFTNTLQLTNGFNTIHCKYNYNNVICWQTQCNSNCYDTRLLDRILVCVWGVRQLFLYYFRERLEVSIKMTSSRASLKIRARKFENVLVHSIVMYFYSMLINSHYYILHLKIYLFSVS